MGTVADDFGPDVAPPAESDALPDSVGTWPPVLPEEREPLTPLPDGETEAPSRPAARPSRSARRDARRAPVVRASAPTTARRYRQTITKVDLWSVLKMSVCFYICAMAVTMVALVALWAIADAAGVIRSVEKFFGDLLQTKDFTFLDQEILRGALLIAAVLVVLEVVITVIAAAFYNLFAELFGGIEITITEDETTL
jgi:hypothetical protein